MYPIESESFVEVSTGKDKLEIILTKVFKGLIVVGCLSFILILVIFVGLKNDDESKAQKQCLAGHYNFPSCIKCDCTSDGSILDCDANGDCICKHGFYGSKCDQCKEGFTGIKCDQCKENITGHNCNECKPTYFNYPLCQECICDAHGSTSLQCGKNNGVCSCKEGFAGIKCHECKSNVAGDKCDICKPGFFGFPSCQKDCRCNLNGSTSLGCDANGQCTCKVGFFGMRCDPNGTKVLVASGMGGRNTEIIDLEDASFKCAISQFPTNTDTPTGGLVDDTAIICGGKIGLTYQTSCFSLNDDGSWKLEESSLYTARRSAATGSVVMHNKLLIAGGSNGANLATIEVVAPNTTSMTLPISLPVPMHAPCIVPWDTNTFMVIGGMGLTESRSQTHFISMANHIFTVTDGPNLQTARHWTGCHTLDVNGEDYIIVAGGSGAEKSTEVLHKANYESGWGKSVDLPFRHKGHVMVASKDKRYVYTIGNFYNFYDSNQDIYKFECANSITSCFWTQIPTKLQFGRKEAIAMPISIHLANKLCTLPKIHIMTADNEDEDTGTLDNLYLEVCDTKDSTICCQQAFNGFQAGGENVFTFNAEFRHCLENSKKLYYFMGITGNDGWKSNGLKIYMDGVTEEVCTLDGSNWLDGDNHQGPRLPLKCQT